MMKATVHRFAQGAGALFAFARRPDLDLARRQLSPCEYKAFRSLSRSEQLHSLNVFLKALEADRAAPASLRSAALLHDVGKSRCQLSTWQKTFAVIIEAISPRLSNRLSEDETISFWRAPFIVRRHHAKWSGEILRNCGSDADVIWLVEKHQENPERHRNSLRYELLAKLQRADGQC